MQTTSSKCVPFSSQVILVDKHGAIVVSNQQKYINDNPRQLDNSICYSYLLNPPGWPMNLPTIHTRLVCVVSVPVKFLVFSFHFNTPVKASSQMHLRYITIIFITTPHDSECLGLFPLVQRLIWAMLLLALDCDFGFVLGYSLLPVPVYIGFAYWFIKRKWIPCSEMVSYYFPRKLLPGCMGQKNL